MSVTIVGPLAETGGRMNAAGISVFYGATDDETAIAGVRPPVGSWVATATFEVIRPLRLLKGLCRDKAKIRTFVLQDIELKGNLLSS